MDHCRKGARAGISNRACSFSHRGAIGQSRQSIDRTQAGAPFGKAKTGFAAKQPRQSAAAGAGLVGPAVEVEVEAGIVQQRAGHVERPRVARHRHVEPALLKPAEFGEDQPRDRTAAAVFVIGDRFLQGARRISSRSGQISTSTGCCGRVSQRSSSM